MTDDFQKICTGSASVLTFPKQVSKSIEQTEMLRVGKNGQVTFNYNAWTFNTATDAFFRELARQAPGLCEEAAVDRYKGLNENLTICQSRNTDMSLRQAVLERQNEQLLATNKALAQKKEFFDVPFAVGFGVGGIFGALLAGWILSRHYERRPYSP